MNAITQYFKRRKALHNFADKYLMPRPQPMAPAPIDMQPPVAPVLQPVTQPAPLPPTPSGNLAPGIEETRHSYQVPPPPIQPTPDENMRSTLDGMIAGMPTPLLDQSKKNLIREIRG